MKVLVTDITPKRPRQFASCPEAATHTPAPCDYIAWHEWAVEKLKTHRQKRCPTCRTFSVWVPRDTKP